VKPVQDVLMTTTTTHLVLAVACWAFAGTGGDQLDGFIGVRVEARSVARQGDLDSNACGPVCVVNALALGDAACRKALKGLAGDSPAQRAETVVEKFASKKSRDYGEGKRTRSDGVSCADLTDIAGEVVAKAGLRAEGQFLDRLEGESDRSFLKRVHELFADGLREGRPPIVSLRSFAAEADLKKKGDYLWNAVAGHFVVITRVPAKLSDHDWGFTFEYVDPESGHVESGYIYLERERAFTAARGNAKKYEWKGGRAFLLATLPSLAMGTQQKPWWSRATVTVNYAITLHDSK
jgi:hypothetical protein